MPYALAGTTNIENDIMPPPPDGQWARPGTVDGSIGRFLLPIGGGSAEGAWTLHFHITAMGGPYSDPGPPTTKHERMLGMSIFFI